MTAQPVDTPARRFLGTHYPQSWEEFIGQEQTKRRLRIAARSARVRGGPMEHVLICGPSGNGKTSLALLIARELRGNLRIETGQLKPQDIPFVFADMKDGDVLFLDEVHRQVAGGKHNGEWLLHYLQDGVLASPLGVEDAPRVTVVAATTDEGRLPETIKDRFEYKPELEPYDDDDGVKIALQLSGKILTAEGLDLPTHDVATAVARASNNRPRLMRRVLIALRDLTLAGEIATNGGLYDLEEALEFAGVTPDGLSSRERRYLLVMLKEYRGNPAGERSLADRLGEVGRGLIEIEQVLLDKGLVAKTQGGRRLTSEGIRRAKDLAA